MNILYVYENISTSSKYEGRYIHNNKTVTALRNKGHKVFIPFEKSLDECVDIKVKRDLYRKMKKYFPKYFEQLWRNIYDIYFDRILYKRQLANYVEKHTPDIIYERLTYFHCAASSIARSYYIPYILEIHTPLSIIPVNSWKKTAKKLYLKNAHMADGIIVVSNALKKELQKCGIPARKIWVIPNAADKDLADKVDNNRVLEFKKRYSLADYIIIGFVGSMAPYHGIDFFIEAAVQLSKKVRDVRFVLVGASQKKSEEEHIKNLINKYNLQDEVIMVGTVSNDEVQNYIKTMDICVLPSRNNWYGSPLKLFEYGIMRKAIVSSRFLPIEEIFDDNKNVLFFEPENISDFAEKIIKLIRDPNLRKKLGEEAYKKVIKFHTWDKNAHKITEICNNVISKKQRLWD